MKYVIYHPDGSLYDCLTIGEMQKALHKGRITREYLAQQGEQAGRQRVGVVLGLEQPGENCGTGANLAQPTLPQSGSAPHTMTSQQSRGRWYLLVPLAGFLALDLTFTALQASRAGLADLFPSVVRIFLSVALMAAVWVGIRWARILLAALFLGTGLYIAYSMFSHFSPLFSVFAGICLISGGVIGFSPSVSSFLAFSEQENDPMKSSNAIMAGAVALLLCGCPATHTRQLAQPERVAVRGAYVHPASNITLPESIGEFQRGEVVRYDAEGLDVSAAYNCLNALHPMAATVYVYPSPSLTSIGSPPEVVEGARAQLTENEFEGRKLEILRAHPGAKLIEERNTTRTESGQSFPGKLAIFEFEEAFAGSRTPVRSHLCLFCYVGGKWTVKYRFTHPKAVDGDKEIQEFIRRLSWYGKAVPGAAEKPQADAAWPNAQVFMLPQEAGFQWETLEIKDGRFRYWFSSDVVDRTVKYPIEGSYEFKGDQLILSSGKTYTVRSLKETRSFWRPFAVDNWDHHQIINVYGILLPVESIKSEKPTLKPLFTKEQWDRSREQVRNLELKK